jgi:quercetin dioxygenase-like cupin family protein
MSFLDTGDLRRFDAAKMQKLNLFEAPQMFSDVYCLEPGQAQKPHAHGDATKFYFVLEGRGRFTVGDEVRELGPGGMAFALPGQPHGVVNASEGRLALLVAMAPNPNPG